jgi:alpha-glucoside transport system substrate-binding protein
VAYVAVLLLPLAACSNTPGGDTGAAGGPLAGNCARYRAYAGHAGTTVTMFASIISPESDSLQRSWAEFSRCTGITISYEGANDFESQLPVRVTGGRAPDLAVIPQPGLLAQLVKTGTVVAPGPDTLANVDAYWNPSWKAYGTVNATFYAAPMGANMKSLVWYSPSAFTDAGYAVPTTWSDMMALSDRIAAAGRTPWCGGIASGTATGWPATDWLEQVVLRTGGGDVYDRWVSHDIRFNSPQITSAMRTVRDWMLNPRYVNGGFGDVRSIATTTFQDAGKPILTGRCYMLQQASFYGAQWPEGTRIADDGDIYAFYLPPINASVPTPVIGGGVRDGVRGPGRDQGRAGVPLLARLAHQPDPDGDRMGLREHGRRQERVHRSHRHPLGEVPDRREYHLPVRRLGSHAGGGGAGQGGGR